MLYSTIPPVLIILSLAGIIIFFMKKAPQIASLGDEEALEMEKMERMATAGFFGKIWLAVKNINWGGAKHFLLVFLERLFHGAKVVFLSLENKSKDLNESIRTKRTDYRNKRAEMKTWNPEKSKEDAIMEKVNNYNPQKKSYLAGMRGALKKENDGGADAAEAEERVIKPMVSDRVVNPTSRAEMKDRLEDLLIERIAANPRDIEAYERLGEYYMEIDSFNDAKECFKQVLKLDPKNKNVKYRMRSLEDMMYKS